MAKAAVAQERSVSTWECIGENILLRRIEDEDEFAAPGVIKPEVARQRTNLGEVVAVGEGRVIGGIWMPMTLKEGDIVRFSRHGVKDVDLDGEMFVLAHWKQIDLRKKCAEKQ